MKKLLAVLLTLMLLTGMVGTALAADEPIVINFMTFQALHMNLYDTMVEKWNANPDNPKIKLNTTVYDFEDMHNKLTIALETGEGAPDMVDIEIGKFANYLGDDIKLAPLNDIVEPVQDDLVMSRLNNYAKDGKYYGIDHHIGATVMFYNTALLESAGIDYTTIKTWDDFHEAGKVLLEKTGHPMVTWESTDCWSIYPLVNQHGGDWLTADNQVRMDEPVVIDTLKFMKSMLDDGTAIASPGGSTHMEEFWGWMDQGEGCAAVSMPFWYIDRFTSHMPSLKGQIKIAPMPLWADGGHKSTQMGGTGTAVVAGCPNEDIVKQFLAFSCLSFDGCITTWKMCGYDPILKTVYGSDEMKETNQFFEYYGQDLFEVLAGVLDDIPDTCLTQYYPDATTIVKEHMAYRIVELGEDPEIVVKECADELRALIK